MARPNIDQLRGLGDFSTLFRWDLQWTTIPSLISQFGTVPTSDDLNFRCESTTLPTAEIGVSEVNIRGHKVNEPSILSYNGSLDLTFLETVDNKVHNFIMAWREALWARKTGVAAGAMNTLKGEFLLIRLNNQDQQVWKYKVKGVFPNNYQLPTLDGSSTDFLKPVITFKYDYFEDAAA